MITGAGIPGRDARLGGRHDAYSAASKDSMADLRHSGRRGVSRIGGGNLPLLTPFRKVLFPKGKSLTTSSTGMRSPFMACFSFMIKVPK